MEEPRAEGYFDVNSSWLLCMSVVVVVNAWPASAEGDRDLGLTVEPEADRQFAEP